MTKSLYKGNTKIVKQNFEQAT